MFGLGLVGRVLSLPYALPAAGIRYCLDKVVEVAEAELMDEGPVKEELLLLQLELEEGAIDEEQYRARETHLLARLREIREYRRSQAQQSAADESDDSGQRVIVVETPDELR